MWASNTNFLALNTKNLKKIYKLNIHNTRIFSLEVRFIKNLELLWIYNTRIKCIDLMDLKKLKKVVYSMGQVVLVADSLSKVKFEM